FDPPLADWDLAARASGLLPGLAARGVLQLIGQPGGLLLAFLALSALTLATLAWHPLHRLEAGAVGREGGGAVGRLVEDAEEESEGVFVTQKSPASGKKDSRLKKQAPPALPPNRPAAHDKLLPP